MLIKFRPFFIGLIISLLLESLIFNFSSLISINNQEIDMMDYYSYQEEEEDGIVLYFTGLNEEINNLHFELDIKENTEVEYEIRLTDEGNFFDYYLPRGHITSKAKASFYTNIHSYGRVKTLTLFLHNANTAYKEPFMIEGLKANVKRPLIFNVMRFIIINLLMAFFLIFKDEAAFGFLEKNNTDKNNKRQIIGTISCVIILILLAGYFSSSHLLFDESAKPHHQQYKELARVLTKGQVFLDDIPSEGVVNAVNPYDTIYLQANGIEYKADYAYYDGHYYVYFGIIPELILYFPFYILTGKDLPNHFAVFFFYALFVIGVFLLIRQIVFRYFREVPFTAYILVSSMVSTCGAIAYLYFTADLYSVPIMAGLAFTALGLYFWMLSNTVAKEKKGMIAAFYLLGSFCMAMVSGCRPQMLLFSLLALPIFWDRLFIKRDLFSKKSLGMTVIICLPYLCVAAIVMYYNYLRFDSVFDFGATYSLTNNDMNLRGQSISRMLLGLGSFLFQTPNLKLSFPFIDSVTLSFDYMGRMVTEHFYGGIIACNLLTWPLAFSWYYRKEIKERKVSLFFIILLAVSVIIGLLDADAAGILQRYSADMAFGILLASAIIIFILIRRIPVAGYEFLKVAFIFSLCFTLMIICNTESGITLAYYNPELFGQIRALFTF